MDTIISLTWNEAKRISTLAERGLEFAHAGELFAGRHFTQIDDRRDYGEPRYISAGYLNRRLVVIVWTPRDGQRRIISLRHANDREKSRFQARLD